LITILGLFIGHTLAVARGIDEDRRGRSAVGAQAARRDKFLRTLISHFLSCAVLCLIGRVLAPALAALLIALLRCTTCESARCFAAAARAVPLASIVVRADVGQPSA